MDITWIKLARSSPVPLFRYGAIQYLFRNSVGSAAEPNVFMMIDAYRFTELAALELSFWLAT